MAKIPILLLLLCSMILTAPISAGEIDITLIGVNDGDQFTFLYHGATYIGGQISDIGYISGIQLQNGSEFTMTIVNANPIRMYSDGSESYEISVNYDNGTHDETINDRVYDDRMLIYGTYFRSIIIPDWNFWEETKTSEYEQRKAEGYLTSYEIINEANQFSFEFDSDSEPNFDPTLANVSYSTKIIYEKSTGVALYFHSEEIFEYNQTFCEGCENMKLIWTFNQASQELATESEGISQSSEGESNFIMLPITISMGLTILSKRKKAKNNYVVY